MRKVVRSEQNKASNIIISNYYKIIHTDFFPFWRIEYVAINEADLEY